MSRAFVKDRDDEPSAPPVFVPAPRIVTAAALERLRARLAAAEPAERPVLERRLESARLAAAPDNPAVVAFGATVTVSRARGKTRAFTITDADDVDIECSRIAEDSPLALALLGRRAGDVVTWHRPAGDERLTIVALDYAEHRSTA